MSETEILQQIEQLQAQLDEIRMIKSADNTEPTSEDAAEKERQSP